ncbi:MAG: UvrD-helicase domain-containing protein [Candidatus Colwellbacteria bacterium]|nr:UvrD-helicase domain-containing protein [Candidatus Colwellbacteria bacterium]
MNLSTLNPRQKEAVTHRFGPLLIIAGPGSGKTRVIAYRIAYLISQGVKPEHILAVTFTNKAAQEMRERLRSFRLLGSSFQGVTMGTFHSICARILRREAKKLGFSANFIIYDAKDQLSLLKRIWSSLGITNTALTPSWVLGQISRAKSELVSPQKLASNAQNKWESLIAQLYSHYQEELIKANAFDFDDLIMKAVELFNDHPATLELYQDQWRHILTDEFQDVNTAQYQLIKLLAMKNRNLCVVGDDAQCVLPDTQITTDRGIKTIATLSNQDSVIAAAGHSKTCLAKILEVKKFTYNGPIVKVTTNTNKVLRLTPNHIVFTRLPLLENSHYVYLMYRRDKGFRVGIAKGARWGPREKPQIGLIVRNNQEKADKVWILKICNERVTAMYWEFYYSFYYGIPTVVFDTGGRNMRISQELINELYKNIDAEDRARKLMEDELIYWRLEIASLKYHRIEEIAEKLKTSIALEVEVVRSAGLTKNKRLFFQPAAHLREGMLLAVLSNREVREEAIIKVEIERYKGYVYDLDVENVHNYIANNIVVHNSIYGFRAADFRNILNFERDWPDAKVVKLEQNYRSTQTILKAASSLIAYNEWRTQKNLWTKRDKGNPISIVQLEDEKEEADFIVKKLARVGPPHHSAIFFRLNAQSRPIEEALIRSGIPYRTVGLTRFYERKEVKDILAYLRLFENPQDTVSMSRIINVPRRGLGKDAFKKIAPYQKELLLAGVIPKELSDKLGNSTKKSLERFLLLWQELKKESEKQSLRSFIQHLRKKIGYDSLIEQSKDPEEKEEILLELEGIASEFTLPAKEALSHFLERASLFAAQSYEKGEGVSLMTVHAAKGLEWPVVFIAGLEYGVFPHYKSLSSQAALEEERRLAYVAITRAKERIFLTYARVRRLYGRVQANPPSNFLEEIPAELTVRKTVNSKGDL